MSNQYTHNSVLCHSVLENLSTCHPPVVVDATFGRGGHSKAILSILPEEGRLFAFDMDPDAAKLADQVDDTRFTFINSRFSEMSNCLLELGIEKVSDIVADLGVSSPQIDDPSRGFSFAKDGPLDMRMTSTGESASDWIAAATIPEMESVFRKYGEERFAKRIANAIDVERGKSAILTTKQLADIISNAIPYVDRGQHPATRVFQAIRIHINKELEELSSVLAQSSGILMSGGRLIVISFHSLEDRIVKRFISSLANPVVPRFLPLKECELPVPSMKFIGRFRPSAAEVRDNRRSRSAILRVAEKI